MLIKSKQNVTDYIIHTNRRRVLTLVTSEFRDLNLNLIVAQQKCWLVRNTMYINITIAPSDCVNFSCFLFPGGFAFLPFLWAINSIWFFKESFMKEHYEQQAQIKKCKFDRMQNAKGNRLKR